MAGLDVICEIPDMQGHSHQLPPETPAKAFAPDSCAVAYRDIFGVKKSKRLRE
jgi:hypothetical protein